jgi:hypothetical protein
LSTEAGYCGGEGIVDTCNASSEPGSNGSTTEDSPHNSWSSGGICNIGAKISSMPLFSEEADTAMALDCHEERYNHGDVLPQL